MPRELQKQKQLTAVSDRKRPQSQRGQPGVQSKMQPKPLIDDPDYRGSGKLEGQVALITGGDSGIGAAAAIAFAKEGADVAIVYVSDREREDAMTVKSAIESYGRRCLMLQADIASSSACLRIISDTMSAFKRLDVLVNNAAYQRSAKSLHELTDEQLEWTFRVNVFGIFYLTRAALEKMKDGSRIINTASVVAYKGSPELLDYSSTKGAVVSFTRSLSQSLLKRNIRVNAVAPGPIWTPFIPAMGRPKKRVAAHGDTSPMERAGQPFECAAAYVFLASTDSSYITGQVIHVNGGAIING